MPEADASVIIKRVACQLFIIKKEKGKESMKIAVTYDNGNVFQHFGKTEFFKVYEVEDNKVISSEVISSNGSGHGALAGLLAEQGIDVLICGGIGGGAAGGQGGHHSGSGQNSNKLFHDKFSFICKTGNVVVVGAVIDRPRTHFTNSGLPSFFHQAHFHAFLSPHA